MTEPKNADAWDLPSVASFFQTHRNTTDQVYPSEWIFLKDQLREGLQVLDIGCALGGLCGVLGEHLTDFSYTGLDISPRMIEQAAARHPDHAFHLVEEGDYSRPIAGQTFDLVCILGILHLHSGWRETVRAGWSHCAGALLMDFRETHLDSVDDIARSYQKMDAYAEGEDYSAARVPYVILNAGEAYRAVHELCPDAKRISRHGYTHPVTGAAVTPYDRVMATAYLVERP